MREFPDKRPNTFGLDNLITKLLKKGMSKRTHGVAYRRLCISLTSDAIGYLDFGLCAGEWWIFRTSDGMLVVIPTALTNWTV